MRIAICFLLFPLLLMAQTGAETDEHAIRAVMDRFMDAWNHHDAKAFAAVFSEDADFTNWRGTGASGRAKIEEFHAPYVCHHLQQKPPGIYRHKDAVHPS
jgi:uncharacterized protein (TIGR02246 family)